MEKIELLAPAKDLFKAKIAVLYGADAVYIGGKSFSLRSRASNFDISDIEEIVSFAHEHSVKVYVTVNIIFHDDDFEGIKEYLIKLDEIGVDAIIVSSIGVVQIAKSVAPHMECHISTQMSTLNTGAVEFLARYGADRVVLGRELSMDEISQVAMRSSVPVEAFIHGGMCSNYSGRCVLSNRMTLRDANRGGCAQSCRWRYKIFDGKNMISDPNILFSMSSKDLRASAYVEEMIKCGVASLKIEGRMKTEYYIAQVVRTYRQLIDEIYENGSLAEDRLAYYDNELSKAENRVSDDGFLSGNCDETKHLYGDSPNGVTHDYVALIKGYDKRKSIAVVEVKNVFEIGDELEVFGPDLENSRMVNHVMFDTDWNYRDKANKPTETIYLKIPFAVKENYMIRKVRRG